MEESIFGTICSSIPWEMIFVAYTFIFIDLFYGIIVSCITKETKSHKMLKGLQNKTFILFIPIIGIIIKAFFITCALPMDWSGTEDIIQFFGVSNLADFPICFLLCSFVIVMELYSILEISAKIDVRAKILLLKFNRELKEDFSNTKITDKILRRK